MKNGYDVKITMYCFEFANTLEEAKERVYKRMIDNVFWDTAKKSAVLLDKEEVMSSIEVLPKQWQVPDVGTHNYMDMMCYGHIREWDENGKLKEY